jgi:hypothetical protein
VPNPKRALAGAALLLPLAACPPTETNITYETVRADTPQGGATEDDPAPAVVTYDATLDYQGQWGSENRSAMRFRFDVAHYHDDAERSAAETLYPTHAAALAAHSGAIPSVQTVGTYAKQLDDTIVAGVERAVAAGLESTIPPKRAVLEGSLAWLSAHRGADADGALAYVAGALRVGGSTPVVPGELASRVGELVARFEADPAVSKPIGFYAWSDELRAAWKVDRWLQQSLPGPQACALARAIAADGARAKHYASVVAVVGKLTNPPGATLLPLVTAPQSGTCTSEPRPVIGASGSAEVALYNRLYPNGIPADADLMHELIKAIRAGLDLSPKPDDGWYQYQAYALETLLVTDRAEERAKIAFTGRYKKRLEEAFSTMLVQHRETHVASLGGAAGAAAPPPKPYFRVEPLATVYVRHARSYVFLEKALEQSMGAALLDKGVAVTPAGPDAETLRQRIRRARDLFYGLYVASCQDLGMHPRLGKDGDPTEADGAALARSAAEWATKLPHDPLAANDVRVMLPIASLPSGRAKYWVILGVRATIAGYSYINGATNVAPDPEDETRVALPTEQLLEVTSSATPLTREEVRALCDKQQTPAAIRAALEAR